MEHNDGQSDYTARDSGEAGEDNTNTADDADNIPDTVGDNGDVGSTDDVIEEIKDKEELIGEIVDMINDKGEVQEDENA